MEDLVDATAISVENPWKKGDKSEKRKSLIVPTPEEWPTGTRHKRRGGFLSTRVLAFGERIKPYGVSRGVEDACHGGPVSTRLDQTEALALLLDKSNRLDAYTREHQARVTGLCSEIMRGMGIVGTEYDRVLSAARLHDIGKIGLPSDLLVKQSTLTQKERALIEVHAERGGHFLMLFPHLEAEAKLVRHHHEHWDGSGYPEGLRETEIPFGSRIIAVADSFDAMTHDRPYREALPLRNAVAVLQYRSGSQWDSDVVSAFVRYVLPLVRGDNDGTSTQRQA